MTNRSNTDAKAKNGKSASADTSNNSNDAAESIADQTAAGKAATQAAPDPADRTTIIRRLNDAYRQTFIGGQVMVTNGTDALDDADKIALFDAIKNFEDFTPDNDPYGEHDFGSLTFKGGKYFWKIDCYDSDLLGHSPDAADPSVTQRVLTIMMAEEY